jgi:hypothetical protein
MRDRGWLALLVTMAACGGGGNEGASYFPDAPSWGADATLGCLSSNECPAGTVCNEFGACVLPPGGGGGSGSGGMDAGMPPPPPEVEIEYGTPTSSDRYIYVPMTAQDELARIDGQTLAVTSTQVGLRPKVLATIPGSDGAVVLDTHNGTATIVRPAVSSEGDTKRVLATLVNLNRVDVDPSGRYAVVWFDLSKHLQGGTLGTVGSFQDVTVIALMPGVERAVNLTVGFRPRDVQFDAAGTRAYVITADGVSVIDLGYATTHGPSIVPPIPVADFIAQETAEVDILPSGQYAAVRQVGESALRVVSVGATNPGASWSLTLPSPATDIDLAPDGTRVYAVSREAQELAIVDIPGDIGNPSAVSRVSLAGHSVGSFVLSADGRRALMFTNATADERITKIELAQPGFPITTWPLKKSVRAVGLSPTGTTAIVINAKMAGDPGTATTTDEYVDRSYGYTLLDLASGFGKLQITPVDPGSFAYAPDGSKAYVALDGGNAVTATRALQVVTTQTGVVITKQLGSPPTAVGILPGADEAFVSQRHPLGRVTFVDLTTDAVRTVTGFDLNGNIVN